MNTEQSNAIRNAFADLIRCIEAIDDPLSNQEHARECAVMSLAALSKAFPDVVPNLSEES